MTISLSAPQPDGLCDTGQGTQCRTWALTAHAPRQQQTGPRPSGLAGCTARPEPSLLNLKDDGLLWWVSKHG